MARSSLAARIGGLASAVRRTTDDDQARELVLRLNVARADLAAQHNPGGRCGAKRRDGGRCGAPCVKGRRRCRLHGGASTGARTPEGRARSLAALNRGARPLAA